MCCTGKELVNSLVCYPLRKTLIASMYRVTQLEILVYRDVNVPGIDFVRDKGGCSSLPREGFLSI